MNTTVDVQSSIDKLLFAARVPDGRHASQADVYGF